MLHVKANFWEIKDITIRNGLKGLVTDEANYHIIDQVLVTQVGEEAIHFRKFSKYNIVINSEMSCTGLKNFGYGEEVKKLYF